MWQAEGKLFVCTWRGKLGVRLRLGKGEVTSSKQWILVSLTGSFRVHAERVEEVAERVEEDAACDGGRRREELFVNAKNFLVLSVKGRLLPLSKQRVRKQKHNEEAGGEKVPQSRDGCSAHAPITAGIFLLGQKEEGWV